MALVVALTQLLLRRFPCSGEWYDMNCIGMNKPEFCGGLLYRRNHVIDFAVGHAWKDGERQTRMIFLFGVRIIADLATVRAPIIWLQVQRDEVDTACDTAMLQCPDETVAIYC